MDNNTPSPRFTPQANLLAAVLAQAAEDLQENDAAVRRDAARFFKAFWFDVICETEPLPDCTTGARG